MKEIIATLANERGVSSEALRKWRERGKVPLSQRYPLFTLASARGVQLVDRDFEFPKSGGDKKRKRGVKAKRRAA